MKTFRNTLIGALLVISASLFAQDSKYEAAMQSGLKLLLECKTMNDYLTAANQFERIAKVEKSHWLPVYYTSYCHLIAALQTDDEGVKDQYLDKALLQAEKANSLKANNSEIYTLIGYIQYMKLSVSPLTRMSFMKSSKISLDKAIQLNPANPRPYFVQGQNIFYTPAVFGGGKAAAKPFFEQAAAKFRDFKPEDHLAPNWGASRNSRLLAECK